MCTYPRMVRLSGVASAPAVIAWEATASQLVTYVSGGPAAFELAVRAAAPPSAATTATSARSMKLRLRFIWFPSVGRRASPSGSAREHTVDGAARGSPAHRGKPNISTADCLETASGLVDNPRVGATADRQVVGREDELALLRDFVAAVADGPRALCVRGEPGIGKTTLWRAAIEAEEAMGLRVLSARCVEAELPLAFVGLADLVRDDFAAAADELSEHDRAALAVAVGLAAPEGPPDAVAVPRAFAALLRLLARDRPLLLAVDDVQWLDVSSRRALSFAARRLADAPVGILVTQRGEGPAPLELARAFDETRF